jgi:glycosyltransferase involved in cell wall biosynthesis
MDGFAMNPQEVDGFSKTKNFSVVIPAYNAEKTIQDTLNSLLSQTHSGWEAIVIDDGSSDETTRIIDQYAAKDDRIRLIRQNHGGESAARNAGVAEARFEWLLFLDADDWISPLYLETMAKQMATDPEVDAIHCRSVRVAGDGTLIDENYMPPVGDLFPILARRPAFPVHACIVRKSLVNAVGGFDTSLQKCPDWDVWQKIARTGARFGGVKDVLAFYRMTPDSASLDARQLLKDGLTVLRTGHGPDPRLNKVHPNYVDGLPIEDFESEQYYFLSWCAGLLLGQGKRAEGLLNLIDHDRPVQLYADAVARCLFESAMLPLSLPPSGWDHHWPKIHRRIKTFLSKLEIKTADLGLAENVEYELKKLLLKHSDHWRDVIESYEADLKKLGETNRILSKEKDDWLEIARQREVVIQEQSRNAAQLQIGTEFLQEQIHASQKSAAQLQQSNQRKSAEIESYLLELENKNTELLTISAQLQDARIAVVQQNDLIQKHENTIAGLQSSLKINDKEIETLTGLVAEKTKHLDNVQRSLEEKTSDWMRGQACLEEKIIELEKRQELLEQATVRLGELENMKISLQTDVANFQKLAEDWKKRYLQLRKQFLVRAGLKLGILKKPDA